MYYLAHCAIQHKKFESWTVRGVFYCEGKYICWASMPNLRINQNCHAEFISASYQHKIETPRLLDPETVLDYSGSHGSNVPLELTG